MQILASRLCAVQTLHVAALDRVEAFHEWLLADFKTPSEKLSSALFGSNQLGPDRVHGRWGGLPGGS